MRRALGEDDAEAVDSTPTEGSEGSRPSTSGMRRFFLDRQFIMRAKAASGELLTQGRLDGHFTMIEAKYSNVGLARGLVNTSASCCLVEMWGTEMFPFFRWSRMKWNRMSMCFVRL